jgi:hypothetical protein
MKEEGVLTLSFSFSSFPKIMAKIHIQRGNIILKALFHSAIISPFDKA